MRKRQLYILSLLSVFSAFGNNCAYGQNSNAFEQKSSQFPLLADQLADTYEYALMDRTVMHLSRNLHNSRWNALTVDWWLCRLSERESISVGDSSVRIARMSVLI